MERYTEMHKSVIYKGSTEDDEDSRHFVKTGRYATEEEATAQCIVYGQQIVDRFLDHPWDSSGAPAQATFRNWRKKGGCAKTVERD